VKYLVDCQTWDALPESDRKELGVENKMKKESSNRKPGEPILLPALGAVAFLFC